MSDVLLYRNLIQLELIPAIRIRQNDAKSDPTPDPQHC
jgi:hypothetical protein